MKKLLCIFIGMMFVGVMNLTLSAQELQKGNQNYRMEKDQQANQHHDVQISFRVKWDGKIIPGITRISGLKRITEVVKNRSGGDPNLSRRSPGMTEYLPIVIQRPRSSDTSFEQWANKVRNLGSGAGAEVSLRDFRKDMVVELVTQSGRVILAFKVYRCWPSEYDALSDLDENDKNSMAMETLVLQHEGWERDYDVR